MSPEAQTLETVPKPLRSFLYTSSILALFCITTILICRFVLHLGFPYDTPVVRAEFNYYDFRMFFDRFAFFHSKEFFTGPANYVFSYPAPMAVVYKLSYILTAESTPLFLGTLAVTFVIAAFFVGKACLRAGLGLMPTIVLISASLLLSDPIWFELNRANLEFFVWVFVSAGVWFYFREKSYAGAVCFGIAGSMKLFPFVYLGLLIAKKQYRETAVALLTGVIVMVVSLWLVCPDVPYAWHQLSKNANDFGRAYLLIRRHLEAGFDHSLFALVKALLRRMPPPAVMSKVLTAYMIFTAAVGTMLFFLRIRFLPPINQLICLTVASVLLPPSSADYTLVHLYAPWVMLVLVAINASRRGLTVPGLGATFICLAVLLSPEKELYFHLERCEGAIKSVTLLALWYLAMKYRFHLPSEELNGTTHMYRKSRVRV